MAGRSNTLRFKVLLAVFLFTVVAWSVLWFVAAAFVDRQLDRAIHIAGQTGTVAGCVNRSVTGFPFRIELRCDAGSHVLHGDSHGEVGGLTVAAQVYDPNSIIAELKGPAVFAAAGVTPMRADWDLAHASARLNLGKQTVERLDAELVDVDLTIGDALVTIKEVDVNVRRDPDVAEDVNFALKMADAVSPGTNGVTTITLRGTLSGGAPLLAGAPDQMVAALLTGDAPVRIEAATLVNGELEAGAKGNLSIDANGQLDGTLDVVVTGYEHSLKRFAKLAPLPAPLAAAMLKEIFATAPDATLGERPAKRLSFHFADGAVRLGKTGMPFPLPFPPISDQER